MSRPGWDDYFMEIAKVVATRATCARKHVGAVVVSPSHQLLSTGYNGAPAGAPHCDDVDHEMVDGHCVRTVHAEANAIAQAARNGVILEGAELYTTASPCYDCGKLIVSAGIKKVTFDEQYDSRYGMSGQVSTFLLACGVTISGFKAGWRPDGGPTEVEKAVAAERERNIAAVMKVVDVILAGQPELERAFIETKFRDLLHVNDISVNKTIDKALYAERNRIVEFCGTLLDQVFQITSVTSGDREKKHEFLRKLYTELHSDKLKRISEALAPFSP